jgi:flagellar biosynthesis GTPase FlhF
VFKKIIIFSLLTFFLVSGVTAQETEVNPGLTPDSPFYFLDTLQEKISLFFSFSTEAKARKALKFAEEKLAEVKAMAQENKEGALEKANQHYQNWLEKANQKAQEAKNKAKDVKSVEELINLITEKTLKHQEVLSEVLERVPDQAKEGIQKAIEVSRKGYEEAIKAVSGAKKQELMEEAKKIKEKVEKQIKQFLPSPLEEKLEGIDLPAEMPSQELEEGLPGEISVPAKPKDKPEVRPR